MDRDWSSTSMGQNLSRYSECHHSAWLENCSWDVWQGIEGICGRRGGDCHTLKVKRVGNTDQPVMHSLMSISSEYYAPIYHFQGSFWIFNSSAMWLCSWVTNFVVVLSLEGEPLLADCYSSMLSQIYPDMTALLRAATQVCLWDFQTAIHILPMLNTFYFRPVYPVLAQHCITSNLCW